MTPKLIGRRSQCTVCGEVFTCPSSFDKHRRGKVGIDRHCIPVRQTEGWGQNRAGLWRMWTPARDFGREG